MRAVNTIAVLLQPGLVLRSGCLPRFPMVQIQISAAILPVNAAPRPEHQLH